MRIIGFTRIVPLFIGLITPSLLNAQILWELGRIGSEPEFEYLVDAVELPSGDILALDWRASQVHRISPSGKHLGSFGRGGQGPGEFIGAEHIGFVGDSIWISDRGNARIVFFTVEGAPLGTKKINVQLPPPVRVPPPTYLFDQQWAVTLGSVLDNIVVQQEAPAVPLLAVELGGDRVRELTHLEITNRALGVIDEERPWAGIFVRNPLGGPDQWAGRPGGGYLAWAVAREAEDSWGVSVHTIDGIGQEGRVTTLEVPRLAPSSSLTQPAIEVLVRSLTARGRDTAQAIQIAKETIAKTFQVLPAYDRLFVSSDSSVWLRQNYQSDWIRIHMGGHMTRVSLPNDLEVLSIHGDRVIYRREDAYGVHILGVYAVDPA